MKKMHEKSVARQVFPVPHSYGNAHQARISQGSPLKFSRFMENLWTQWPQSGSLGHFAIQANLCPKNRQGPPETGYRLCHLWQTAV